MEPGDGRGPGPIISSQLLPWVAVYAPNSSKEHLEHLDLETNWCSVEPLGFGVFVTRLSLPRLIQGDTWGNHQAGVPVSDGVMREIYRKEWRSLGEDTLWVCV